MRARYYNPNKGRFFQEDSYLGDISDPLTLNRYAYTKNSPLNYMDPSGHVKAPQGTDAHEILFNYLLDMGYDVEKKKVIGYKYSKSGEGNVDVFYRPLTGLPEVYELKTIFEPEYREDSWLDKHIPGAIRQRQGYIEALEKMGIQVNKEGTSLNSVINGKILHSAKYDKDIIYVMDPIEYGIVYWSYVGRKHNYDEIKEWMLRIVEKSYFDKCEKEGQEDDIITFPAAEEKGNSIAAMWAEIKDNLYGNPEYQNVRDQIDQMVNLLRLLEMVTERAFPLVPLPPEEAIPGKWKNAAPHYIG